jgi:hypothetical protein
MKRYLSILMVGLFLSLFGVSAFAAPINLNPFSTNPADTGDPATGITVSVNVVTFTEDIGYSALYFYNDSFIVPSNASILSFDFNLILQDTDIGDYISFEIGYVPVQTFATAGMGHYDVDLSLYRNQTISLAWGLLWAGDDADTATSVATVSNIDLSSASTSVPEPSALILLMTGASPFILVSLRRRLFTRM